MQQIGFLLQNVLFSQHVSGTIMLIITSSRFIQMVATYGTWRFGLEVVGHSSRPDQRPVNQSAKYHRQQPSV